MEEEEASGVYEYSPYEVDPYERRRHRTETTETQSYEHRHRPTGVKHRHSTTRRAVSERQTGGYWLADDDFGYWPLCLLFLIIGFSLLILIPVFVYGGFNGCWNGDCDDFCEAVAECDTIEDILARLAVLEAAP